MLADRTVKYDLRHVTRCANAKKVTARKPISVVFFGHKDVILLIRWIGDYSNVRKRTLSWDPNKTLLHTVIKEYHTHKHLIVFTAPWSLSLLSHFVPRVSAIMFVWSVGWHCTRKNINNNNNNNNSGYLVDGNASLQSFYYEPNINVLIWIIDFTKNLSSDRISPLQHIFLGPLFEMLCEKGCRRTSSGGSLSLAQIPPHPRRANSRTLIRIPEPCRRAAE